MFFIIEFILSLSSCDSERISELEEENQDTQSLCSSIERDFYVAYSALERINDSNDIDSMKEISSAVLKKLGEMRFYKDDENRTVTDIANLEILFTDTIFSSIFDDDFFEPSFEEKREIFYKAMEEANKTAN